MKKLILPLIAVAFLIAFFNQKSKEPNIFITVIAIVIFMFAMMQLSANTPSKNQNNDDTEI